MLKSVRYAVLAGALSLSFCGQAAPAGDLPLMPWPQKVELSAQAGYLTLDNEVSIAIRGDDLEGAVERWRQRIALQTGWELKPQSGSHRPPTITVTIAQRLDPQPRLDSDESYHLSITAEGVKLNAATRFGALRGMETLLQLIRPGAERVAIPWIEIEDRPRFPWRGLLIDSARHFMPVSTILRQLDGMAAAKLNVFHWHLTDDQGWRFASTHYPKLQQLASDGQFYTQAQMREVVRYATERGIRVVPEFDVPGHASAIAVAYPELMSAPGPYAMEREWGVLKPVLDPTKEETYRFIDTLVGELAGIFPDSYLHIGGDEVDDTQWRNNPDIQNFMRQHQLADSHALHTWFNQRLETILAKHQRRMVGWDEIFHPSLPKRSLIQSWQGQDALGSIARAGYQGILSTGFYLDQPHATAYHYRNEVLPQGLNDIDKPRKGDRAQSWSFTMPRLKGSAVEGSFTLIADAENRTWRGFIDFKGKSRRAVRDITWPGDGQVSFSVDTWMGETRPVLTLRENVLSGYFLVGNTRYPASGKRLEDIPEGRAPVVPEQEQMANILGGEAALWAENVIAPVMDIKLWPRAFSVAERLWSARDVNDVDNMYRRLAQTDAWSTISVGLQQHDQSQRQMMRLAGTADILPLQILAQALEPAQYYTRNHLKFQAGNYHQFEPLNRLADALGPESMTTRQMQGWVDALIANPRDKESAQALRRLFIRWQDNYQDLLPLLEGSYQLRAIKPVAEDVAHLAALGLKMIERIEKRERISAAERALWQSQLDEAARVRDELVIAAVYPLEKLLRAGVELNQ
ncbi:family 20 glycosylhydrolase [Enterobacteriaceae bacterium BIT-l23]|uniref:beta-N-acetylhexosaminidase n=1 Tax=Jejubacter sp. L23 TaxID=3092086 RepID=UPI0015859E4C|nr:family 20 glycosylhydrolase [Enterobacteriaceae bacterium BIT-l23]